MIRWLTALFFSVVIHLGILFGYSAFTQEKNEVFRFATDFTVDHIAINNGNNIAALTLGSKGIALYDIADPKNPIERGLFSIGYTYSSVFWDDNLVVCSREGLQIISIYQ